MIGNKVLSLSVLVTCLSLAPLYGMSVSLQVVQGDAAHDEVRSPSFLIESGIMDYFFEQGVIVSNLPTVLSAKGGDTSAAVKKGIEISREGALDYFVQVVVDYNLSSLNDSPEAKLLSSISDVSYQVFDVRTSNSLGGRRKKIENLMRNQNTEIGITNFASDLAVDIYSFLLKR